VHAEVVDVLSDSGEDGQDSKAVLQAVIDKDHKYVE
jgi:hypothetical protein